MTMQPALAALGVMDPAWKDAYEGALPAATAFVARLPLVRVVVPHRGPRKGLETDDALRDGKLLPRHKSDRSADGERRLGAANGIYFHAGRTHPVYGKVAFVFSTLAEEDRAEVTPFGLGGLLCDGTGVDHEQRRCVTPVAHLPDLEQAAFVAASTWRSQWRDQAPQFLAAYFGSELDAYFAAEDEGRPTRLDPAGVFDSTTGSRDWRAWTFEVRIAAEIDLHRVLDSGRVMMWAMEDQLYNDLVLRTAGAGEPPWWFSKLIQKQVRRIGWPNALFEEVLMAVDAAVRQACRV
jgi:hypothetical protein